MECYICLDNGSPLVSLGCACTRVDQGWAHVDCVLKAKEFKREKMKCDVCNRGYKGVVELAIIERWDNNRHKRLAETIRALSEPELLDALSNDYGNKSTTSNARTFIWKNLLILNKEHVPEARRYMETCCADLKAYLWVWMCVSEYVDDVDECLVFCRRELGPEHMLTRDLLRIRS
jgi:hypothetical protein